jgi:hypothetical protein
VLQPQKRYKNATLFATNFYTFWAFLALFWVFLRFFWGFLRFFEGFLTFCSKNTPLSYYAQKNFKKNIYNNIECSKKNATMYPKTMKGDTVCGFHIYKTKQG